MAPAPAARVPAPRASVEDQPAAARRRRRGARARAGDLLLSLLALLGLATTGLTLAAALSGLQPLVVRSGSMAPAVPAGGLVLVRDVPASSLRPGDVATVLRPDGTRVTHRVVSTEARGPLTALLLKGDANRTADPEPVVTARAAEVVLALPWAGRVPGELASARGGFLLGALCVLLTRRARR